MMDLVFQLYTDDTDSTMFNYNPSANTPDPNDPCTQILMGCTDSTAVNYYALSKY